MRIALAFLLTGCVAMPTNGGPTGGDHVDDDDDSMTTPNPQPAKPVATGAYNVHSTIDLTPELVLPEPAEMVVLTLREFSTNPASAMIQLAADAGVPAIDDLPSYLQDKLEGWINAEIAKVTVNGTPITQVAGSIAGLAETSLSTLELDSELDTSANTHTLTHVNLPVFDASFDLAVNQPATCASNAGALAIGDHTYGLAYGEYIWTALNDKMVAEYGYDLRGALGAAVNCPSLAHTIANKCVWSVCVGHETQLTNICEAGLDEVAGRVHDKLAEMRFDALHFIAGEATLVDDNHDGAADALAAGTWTAELDAGQGLRHVPATFTGER